MPVRGLTPRMDAGNNIANATHAPPPDIFSPAHALNKRYPTHPLNPSYADFTNTPYDAATRPTTRRATSRKVATRTFLPFPNRKQL